MKGCPSVSARLIFACLGLFIPLATFAQQPGAPPSPGMPQPGSSVGSVANQGTPSPPSPPADVVDLHRELLSDISKQTARITWTITILAILVTIISILFPVLFFILEHKRSVSVDRWEREAQSRIEEVKEKSDDIKAAAERTLESIQKEVEGKWFLELRNTYEAKLTLFKNDLLAQKEAFQELLLRKAKHDSRPIEARMLKVERARIAMWEMLFPKLKSAAEGGKWGEFMEGWSDIFKYQVALAQLVSSDRTQVFTSLGTLASLAEIRIVPGASWDLVLLLKKQGAMRDPQLVDAAQRLGDKLKRSWEEKLIEDEIDD